MKFISIIILSITLFLPHKSFCMKNHSTRTPSPEDRSGEEKTLSNQVIQKVKDLSIQESTNANQGPFTHSRPCNYKVLRLEANRLVGAMQSFTFDKQDIEKTLCFLYNADDLEIKKKYESDEGFQILTKSLLELYPTLADHDLQKHFSSFVRECSGIYYDKEGDPHKKISVYMLLDYAKKPYMELMDKYEKIYVRRQRNLQKQ